MLRILAARWSFLPGGGGMRLWGMWVSERSIWAGARRDKSVGGLAATECRAFAKCR